MPFASRFRWALLLLAATAFTTTHAADFTALKPEGYVSDFARVLDGLSRADLDRYCGAVEGATGVQMALVTIDTLEGEPVEDVANALFRKWGVGKKGKDEGILLLLVIKDRHSRLEVGYGLEPIIPDGFSGSVLRAMRPALRDQHYGDALIAAARTIGDRIAQAKGVTISVAPQPRRRRQPESRIPWPALIGGVFLLFWLFSMGSRGGGGMAGYLPAMILGNMIGRSSDRGRGSGGFGGFDSGDGFGGFGGGDSGGGGASSDW